MPQRRMLLRQAPPLPAAAAEAVRAVRDGRLRSHRLRAAIPLERSGLTKMFLTGWLNWWWVSIGIVAALRLAGMASAGGPMAGAEKSRCLAECLQDRDRFGFAPEATKACEHDRLRSDRGLRLPRSIGWLFPSSRTVSPDWDAVGALTAGSRPSP